MGAVVVESFVEHFDRNFNAIKDEMYQELPKEYPNFLTVDETQKAFIKSTYMGGLGMPERNRDLEPIPFRTPPKGPIATFVPVGYRSGYQIERQMIEQEEWGLLANRPRTMLYGANVLMDIAAANLFNNGFTPQNYDQGYDLAGTALPLFSAVNTLENLSGTWTNVIAQNLPITVETVFYAITALLYNMVDSRGLPISYTGAFRIYVPTIAPTLWQQAIEVVNSVMNPGTTDNKVNAVMKQFRLEVVPLRHLTNVDHWFITWEPSSPNYGLKMVVNVYPDITPLTPFGGNPDAWFSRLRMRFTVGYDNKRGVAAVGA